jgi:hypothetical protein
VKGGGKIQDGNFTQHGEKPILCNYLTFTGDPEANSSWPGGIKNPTLDNTYDLTGALVSHFPAGQPEFYTDKRTIGEEPNEQAMVALDYNAALVNLAAALVALPDGFYGTPCPTIKEVLAQQDQETAGGN